MGEPRSDGMGRVLGADVDGGGQTGVDDERDSLDDVEHGEGRKEMERTTAGRRIGRRKLIVLTPRGPPSLTESNRSPRI